MDGAPQPSFWSERTENVSAFHKAPINRERRANSGVLLVLGGGFGANPVTAWQEVLPRLMHAAPECDVLSFSPGAFTSDSGALDANVQRLGAALGPRAADASHILFAGHGAGALTIKALLASAMAQAVETARAGGVNQHSFTFKTRRVVSTAAAAALEESHSALKRALGVFKKPQSDGEKQATFVREIDEALAEALAAFAQRGWPYPHLDEFLLQTELSADNDANEGSLKNLYGPFARVHAMPPEMKAWPRAYGEVYTDDLIVTPSARQITALQNAAGLQLTNKILSQFYDRPEPVRLIGDEGDLPAETEKVTATLRRRGTQGSVFARLHDLAMSKHKSNTSNFSVVISGEAGLGKTTLMRRLAQSAAFNFFRAPAPTAPAPIFINMPTVSVETLSIGGAAGEEYLAQTILDALFELISDNFSYGEGRFATREAVRRALAQQATLLILDGVDEFLVNTPVVRLVHIRMAIEKLLAEAGDADLRVFIGIRNSVRNYAQLASSPNNVFLLSSLTTRQAERHFRGVSRWITKIEHAPLGQAFLTPLILSAFQEANLDVEGELATAADLWELALRAILSKSGIAKVRTGGGLSTSADEWIVALSIVAAAFHMTLRHDFSLNELRNQTESMRASWRSYLDEASASDGGGKDPFVGFDLISNERTLEALIESSVFAATARHSVQFSHREWQDYLTARYAAMSIEFGNVDEIGRMAFNVPIYRTAGQLLTQQAVNETLITRAIQRTRETRNEFIIGNLGALIGNAVAPITRPAIMRLFELVPKYTPLIQTIIIGSVGRRALQSDDPSAIDIRIGIEPTLRLLADQTVGDRYNRIAESISWCFLKAYHRRFGTPPPPGDFGPFSFDDGGFDDALAVVCTRTDEVWTYDNKFASVQDTFTSIQELVLVDPVTRPISVAHYLACITAARIAGAQIPEVTEELGAILEPGSAFETAFEAFGDVPEIFDLYKSCQSAYRSFAGGQQ